MGASWACPKTTCLFYQTSSLYFALPWCWLGSHSWVTDSCSLAPNATKSLGPSGAESRSPITVPFRWKNGYALATSEVLP